MGDDVKCFHICGFIERNTAVLFQEPKIVHTLRYNNFIPENESKKFKMKKKKKVCRKIFTEQYFNRKKIII